MIKPIWVLINDGESDKLVVARGSLSVVSTGEFEIDVSLNGYTLKIHVEFTQAELEDETPIDDWYIDTNDAQYLFTSDAQNISPIAKDVIENAELGTITEVLGLDEDGGLVKESRDSVVKPIYWHGVNMFKVASSKTTSVQFHVLSNNDTPLNTIAKIKAWAESISGTVLIACNGTIPVNDTFYPCIAINKNSDRTYDIYYIDSTDGAVSINNIELNDYFANAQDNINKIN